MSRKHLHHLTCAYRPPVTCYYKRIDGCVWEGNGEDFPDHLSNVHNIVSVERSGTAKYLWNPPCESLWRYRFRLIKHIRDEETRFYILEHYYDKKEKMSSFLLRDPCGTSQRRYRISIVNRSDETNRIILESQITGFDNATN